LQPQLIDGVRTHALDVAIVHSPYQPVDPPPRFLRLGAHELIAVIPEGHRLAELDRVPRSELLNEPFLDWPRSINPEMIDHLHRLLFGSAGRPPHAVTVPELEEAGRFAHVAQGRGIGITGYPGLTAEAHFPGIVFRPLDEPTPSLEYGVVWSNTPSSPFVPAFLEVAEEVAEAERMSA
jgi:DNA-binding transcriptional LysR family regulator